MVAECFKLVIEYIIMTAEAWFSLVVGEWRFFPWFLLGFAGFGGTPFRPPKGV